jgi:hypothetical protein
VAGVHSGSLQMVGFCSTVAEKEAYEDRMWKEEDGSASGLCPVVDPDASDCKSSSNATIRSVVEQEET